MAKVVEKLNDWLLKLSMKVVQLAAKAKSKALSLLSGAAGVVSKFAKKYPKLAKGLSIVIGIGIMAAVMTASPDAAQADLVFQGQVVTEDQANVAVEALVKLAKNIEAAEAASGTVQGFESDYYNAAEHIQDLVDATHGSKEAESIKGDLGERIKSALEWVKKAESENPEVFNKMAKAGEDLAVISPEGTSGSLQAVDMSMFQGKDNIFDTVKGYIMDTAKNSGDRMAILDQNQNLIDLNTWRETGKFPEGASKQIQNLVDNFEALSKGENVTGGKMMKSDRFEYFKRLMDLGKNTTMQITTNKGVIQI